MLFYRARRRCCSGPELRDRAIRRHLKTTVSWQWTHGHDAFTVIRDELTGDPWIAPIPEQRLNHTRIPSRKAAPV